MSYREERLKNLTPDEVAKLKMEGYEVIRIIGKNYYYFLFSIAITLGISKVGKTSIINT